MSLLLKNKRKWWRSDVQFTNQEQLRMTTLHCQRKGDGGGARCHRQTVCNVHAWTLPRKIRISCRSRKIRGCHIRAICPATGLKLSQRIHGVPLNKEITALQKHACAIFSSIGVGTCDLYLKMLKLNGWTGRESREERMAVGKKERGEATSS